MAAFNSLRDKHHLYRFLTANSGIPVVSVCKIEFYLDPKADKTF